MQPLSHWPPHDPEHRGRGILFDGPTKGSLRRAKKDESLAMILTGLLAVFCVRPALADAASCSPMAIEGDRFVSTRWPGLLERVRNAFEARMTSTHVPASS